MLCWNPIFIGSPPVCSREDFQRIPELAINPLGDRIINAFFPEGWAVPVACLLFLEILFCFFLRSVRYRFESHPPQIWTRPSGFSLVADWLQRSSIFSANSVFEKSRLGFLYRVLSVYLKVVWLFNQSESWKSDVFRCIVKMRRHLNVSHSFYWLQMHSCCTVFWLLCFKKKLENRGGVRFIL